MRGVPIRSIGWACYCIGWVLLLLVGGELSGMEPVGPVFQGLGDRFACPVLAGEPPAWCRCWPAANQICTKGTN